MISNFLREVIVVDLKINLSSSLDESYITVIIVNHKYTIIIAKIFVCFTFEGHIYKGVSIDSLGFFEFFPFYTLSWVIVKINRFVTI